MNYTFAVAVIISMIYVGRSVFGYQLEMLKMKIIENGKELDEKIYVDRDDKYEIFSVPAHGDLSALLLVNDFKRNNSIYKVADDRTCYVLPLDANEEKPMQLKKSVEKVHGNFPTATVTVQHKTFLKKRAFDLSTDIGKMAQKFCGDYEVVEAEEQNGFIDLNKIAQEEERKLATMHRRVKRQDSDVIPFVMDMICPGNQNTAMQHYTTCQADKVNGGDMKMHASCDFQSPSCIYKVNCDFSDIPLGADCDSSHYTSAAVCCTYTCS